MHLDIPGPSDACQSSLAPPEKYQTFENNCPRHQHCQVQENNGGNSRNSGCQVQTYEISEGTSASAYVLCPKISEWEDRILEIGVLGIRVVLGVELRG